ncbi:unnamed protein product [Blepharisma stoltei]|uniref:Uncharacterized protein n=1 Tax=Blepharisma stoltei TaxID=1481888 RepID=A0AAU9K3G9_9CILI|nr:unnamed protein product [Blepharisma stoltei]
MFFTKIWRSSFQLFFKILLTAIVLSTCSEVLIVFSSFSKNIIPSLKTEIKSRNLDISLVEVVYCDFSALEETISQRTNLIAIFDITDNLNIEFEISKICMDNLLIHFLASDSLPYKNKLTFSLSSSKENLHRAIISTLRFFNWTIGIAVSSVEEFANTQIMLNNYSEKIQLFQ